MSIKVIAELHIHSSDIACDGFTPLAEYAEKGKKLGLKYFASTHHGPFGLGCDIKLYTKEHEREFEGIKFLTGMEADIRDTAGSFDIADGEMLKLDFVLASMHGDALMPLGYPDYTEAYNAAIRRPFIDCVGHVDRLPQYPVNFRAVAKETAKYGKLIELNSATIRIGERVKECGEVIDACAEFGTGVVITSDAHDLDGLGRYYQIMIDLLEKHNFPEELIVNADEKRMEDFLVRRRREKDAARAELFAGLDHPYIMTE